MTMPLGDVNPIHGALWNIVEFGLYQPREAHCPYNSGTAVTTML